MTDRDELTGLSAPISAFGLRKAYGDRTVLDGVDLHVGPGQVVGLLGPNGAGRRPPSSGCSALSISMGPATVPGARRRPRRPTGARFPPRAFITGWLDFAFWSPRPALGLRRRTTPRRGRRPPAVGLAGRGDDRVAVRKGCSARVWHAVLGRPAS